MSGTSGTPDFVTSGGQTYVNVNGQQYNVDDLQIAGSDGETLGTDTSLAGQKILVKDLIVPGTGKTLADFGYTSDVTIPVIPTPSQLASLAGMNQIYWFGGSSFVAFLEAFMAAMEMIMNLQAQENIFNFQGMLNQISLGQFNAMAIGASMQDDILKEKTGAATSFVQSAMSAAAFSASIGSEFKVLGQDQTDIKELEAQNEEMQKEEAQLKVKVQKGSAAEAPDPLPPAPKDPGPDAPPAERRRYEKEKAEYDKKKAEYDDKIIKYREAVQEGKDAAIKLKQNEEKIKSNKEKIKDIKRNYAQKVRQLVTQFTDMVNQMMQGVNQLLASGFDTDKQKWEMLKAMLQAYMEVNKQATDAAHQSFQTSIQELDSMIQLLMKLSQWAAQWGSKSATSS